MAQIAEVLSNVSGKEVIYQSVSHNEAVRRGLHVGTVCGNEWMEAVPGYGFDINEKKQFGISLKSFKQWVCENKNLINLSQSFKSTCFAALDNN